MPASCVLNTAFQGPADTFVHRLDVRTKMAVSLLASAAVVFLTNPSALALLAAGSSVYALSLRRVRLLLVVYAAVGIMWILAMGMMTGLHALLPQAPAADLSRLPVPFLRTWVMINAALGLALSSRIQTILGALKTLRLPFCIYVPLALMVRFLPTFVEDVRQIAECIRTRGYPVSPLFPLRHPVLATRLLLMPLLFRSLRSSDELGMAAELKGLGEARRLTPAGAHRFGREDLFMAAATLCFLATGATLQLAAPAAGGMGL